jgi:hypothetical protein
MSLFVLRLALGRAAGSALRAFQTPFSGETVYRTEARLARRNQIRREESFIIARLSLRVAWRGRGR